MTKRKRADTPAPKAGEQQEATHFGSFSHDPKKKAQKPKGVPNSPTSAAGAGEGPFPGHARPLEAECRAARDSLALLHGEPQRPFTAENGRGKSQYTILDSLVRTILSQNTTDTNSQRTFANLKADFPDWDAVRNAKPGDVEAAIKLGGLAATKTTRIQNILSSVMSERGECSLEHLREQPDEDIKKELLQYTGVGPKTAACVLMFCLGRFEFPVDTHVWRITKSLGWVPAKASREQTYEHLNARIPGSIKYDLHVLLVEHGKRCPRCSKNHRPRKEVHGPCPLTNLATAVGQGSQLSPEKAAEDAKQALGEMSEEDDKDGIKLTTEPEAKQEAEEEVKSDLKKEEVKIKEEPVGSPPEQSQSRRREKKDRGNAKAKN